MTNNRRYRKSAGRRVWVFSEPNPNLSPKDIARILASAALEAEARSKGLPVDDANAGLENDHD